MNRELVIATHHTCDLVDITEQVRQVVRTQGMQQGLCHLFVPHTTAGITLNENWDPDVRQDMLRTLTRLVPRQGDYRHGEGNSQAHILASLLGFEVAIPVSGGALRLGTWQGVYLAEFDGPRRRTVRVTLLPA